MPTKTPGLVEPGEPAPTFDLPDQLQKRHRLGDYAGRWVVLYFYPKDNTPGCTIQACGFRDADEQLRDLGVVVLGVSADSAASHEKFARKYALPFPLLADEGAEVAQAYGVWREKSLFGHRFMGIVRTTYLIDPQGRVARRWDKVKVKGHTKAVLEAVRELAGH